MSVFSVTRFSIHYIIYYTDPTFKGDVMKTITKMVLRGWGKLEL